MARGTLFLIVGPSGSGKDTLIDGVRQTLAKTHLFPRRAITRPRDAGSEDHVAKTPAEFEACEQTGNFALSWRAHGLAYGVPAAIETDLARGKHVVVNGSRGIVEEARAKFAPLKVIEVTAPASTLRQRLLARGREQATEIDERVARQSSVRADVVVVNDGTVEQGVAALLAALRG
ncbi:MAG: phosphonate metabolism protein/1,5-bisphosphokinase (PRPP-forming) PhnN [Alphaproteobacteria bacterium]|nr:phosphonate metabolism protein/1,5-bisphosphokinase (PRPP-forming) PhnN [Alphaproteobacteria bacterium]